MHHVVYGIGEFSLTSFRSDRRCRDHQLLMHPDVIPHPKFEMIEPAIFVRIPMISAGRSEAMSATDSD